MLAGHLHDSIIKEKMGIIKDKKNLNIISNDNEIKDRARVEGAKIIPVLDFVGAKSETAPYDDKKLSEAAESAITSEMERIFLKNK